ncbi:MAG: ATP-binding protein [Pirellulales bacterium]
MQAIPDLMFRLDADGRILDFFASKMEELLVSPEQFLGKRMQDVLPDDVAALFHIHLQATAETRQSQSFEYELDLPQLGPTHFEARMVPCDKNEIVTIVRNTTERKQAETKQRKLETRLAQAQKMEAIGRLAGGIAHDFNNLLTVINGYSELLLKTISSDDRRHAILTDVRQAGDRAASLTRQLLTFSRRQITELRVVDLNVIVAESERMLRRLIGDDILLQTKLHVVPACVNADPSQLEQVIMNLAVNARDAMPTGGMLTIRTEVIDVDGTTEPAMAEAAPGRYVALVVVDTGCGVPEDIQDRIFEPFFTTKGLGKGTGLGLATVHSIAVETGGFLSVTSEPGQGSIFRVFLPAIDAPATVANPSTTAPAVSGGVETVLLVEDDDSVRLLTLRMLEDLGYTVLPAPSGADAIRFVQDYQGRIDLLLTDVIMPEMSGRELTERLQVIRPDLKTLYVSGYTDDEIVRHGVLRSETAFLQKPFSIEALAGKVRRELDAGINTNGKRIDAATSAVPTPHGPTVTERCAAVKRNYETRVPTRGAIRRQFPQPAPLPTSRGPTDDRPTPPAPTNSRRF